MSPEIPIVTEVTERAVRNSDTTTWLQSVCRPVSYSATRVFLMALMKPQQTYRVFVGRSLMALQSVSYDTTTDYKAFVDRFCVTLQNL